jgi:hypothetical protein
VYAPLVRCDQRAKAEQYVRGLLLDGRRKSIQPMAARLPDGDEQGLQQFPAGRLVATDNARHAAIVEDAEVPDHGLEAAPVARGGDDDVRLHPRAIA